MLSNVGMNCLVVSDKPILKSYSATESFKSQKYEVNTSTRNVKVITRSFTSTPNF